MNSNKSHYVLYALILFCGLATGINAQEVDTMPVRGFMPNHAQLSGSIDNIDILSGKLNLTIPLGSLPRGPGGISYDLNLRYESNRFNLEHHDEIAYVDGGIIGNSIPILYRWAELLEDGGGWDYGQNPYRIETDIKVLRHKQLIDGQLFPVEETDCQDGVILYRTRVRLPDGSSHTLYLKGYEGLDRPGGGYYYINHSGIGQGLSNYQCTFFETSYRIADVTNGTLTYYTNDGSYLKYEVVKQNGTTDIEKLYFPDGRIVTWESGVLKEYDANGNCITFSGGTISNQAEQAISIIPRVAYGNGWRRDEIQIPGPNGLSSYYLDWQNESVAGITYETGDVTPYQTPLPEHQYETLNRSGYYLKHLWLPTAIGTAYNSTLGTAPPVGSGYVFDYWFNVDAENNQYQGLGELNFIRTPSGAKYRYLLEYQGDLSADHLPSEILSQGARVYKKTITHDSGPMLTWQFTESQFSQYGADEIINPDGGKTLYYYNNKQGGNWDDKLVYKIEERNHYNQLLMVRKQYWAENVAYGLGFVNSTAYYPSTPNNPYVVKEIVTAYSSTGTGPKSAITKYEKDKNGRLVTKTEHDWFNGVADNTTNATVNRVTKYDYYINVSSASLTTDHENAWWNAHNTSLPGVTALGPRRLDAVRRVTVYDGSNIAKAATEYVYDNAYTKGNVTYERRWDSVKAAFSTWAASVASSAAYSQEFQYVYDGYGNVTDIYEPSVGAAGQPRTRITYNTGVYAGAYVEKVETGYGTNEKRTVQYDWYNSGAALWKKTDSDNSLTTDSDNSLTTEYLYDDSGRVLEVRGFSGANTNLRGSWTYYDDANRTITVKSDLHVYGDELLQTRTHYDQLGRAYLVQQSDGSALASATDGIKVKTIEIYPSLVNGQWAGERMTMTTTPYRDANMGDDTFEWNCTQYDTLGRIVRVSTFKNSTPATSTPPVSCASNTNRTGTTEMTYSAEVTTVTDPAGNQRQQKVDALGRLIEVIEDPGGSPLHLNYITTYAYDALDNLTGVTQIQASPSATQTRTFIYSSLGWLLKAINPESEPTNYTYHDSGDLNRKTYSRVATDDTWSELTYDALHRVITKSYSDSTPAVTYTYYQESNESPVPNIGQLKSVSSSVSATTYGYNTLGQVISSSQTIDGYGTKSFSYDWYLNGALKQQAYPSGKVVNYSVDNAGRTDKVSYGVLDYANLTSAAVGTNAYTADGRIAKMKLGNGLYETRDYRTPGMPTVYKLETANGVNMTQLEYDFAAQTNNGNVQAQRIVRNGTTWSQSYVYDAVNRLSYASEAGGWNRTYGYDRYGNRYITSPKSGPSYSDPHEPTLLSDFNAANNRLTMAGTGYDAAGNQTSFDGMTLTYDAEGRNTTAVSGGVTLTFSYDGEGRRVKKSMSGVGGVTTYYVYNALGQLAAEYDNNPTPATGTSYLFTDMLGSVRTITNAGGTVTECYDYLPFGRILGRSDNGRNAAGLNNCFPATPDTNLTSVVDEKFTGQKRDETGLDYFGARYFSAPLGRFISPDPLWVNAARMLDPQRLNLYAYTRNNPLKYIDPTGLELQMGDCGYYSMDECFELLKSGLRKEDRDALSLIKGTGKNNCSIGATCVSFDSSHKSDSVNFNDLKSVADARGDIAILKGKGVNDNVASFTFSVVPIAEQYPGIEFTMYKGDTGFEGLTLFPKTFAEEAPKGLFSRDNNTHVVFAHGMDTDDIVKAIYHEIRHIVLGDFGRTLSQSNHFYGDTRFNSTEEEALRNSKEK